MIKLVSLLRKNTTTSHVPLIQIGIEHVSSSQPAVDDLQRIQTVASHLSCAQSTAGQQAGEAGTCVDHLPRTWHVCRRAPVLPRSGLHMWPTTVFSPGKVIIFSIPFTDR